MKTVFTNREIMHVFNLQEQKNGRTANVFFEGNKIYSYGYHYLLGEILKDGSIIINNKGYSNTTAKHINYLINATRNRKQYLYSNIDIDTVNYTLKDLLNKIPRATKNKLLYKNQIVEMYNNYIEYITNFRLKTKWNKNKNHRENIKLFNKFFENSDQLETEILEQQEKNKIQEKKRIETNLKKWRNFEIDYFRNNTNKDYLRYIGITQQVQTSQGVKISVEEAKRLCKLIDIKQVIGQKVDNKYLVMACNGIFKVGCHNIDISEINRIREQINI